MTENPAQPIQTANPIQKAHCASCGNIRNCEIVSCYKESGTEAEYVYWNNEWRVMRCRGCDYVFLMVTKTNSEDYFNYYNEIGEPETEYRETLEYWPALSRRERPDWLSEIPTDERTGSLKVALNEVYGALDSDLKILAAIGMRTAFDATASAIGVDASLPFVKKLDQLIAGGLIREAERPQLETVIDAGSASVHRGWEPEVAELNLLMEVLETFIFEAIVAPKRKIRREKELEAVRVPKRHGKRRAAKLPIEASEAETMVPDAGKPSDVPTTD